MSLIKFFSHIQKSDVAVVGGKGASLGEMINSGLPVPAGFVIVAEAFKLFLRDNNREREIQDILDQLNYENLGAINGASAKIRALIMDSPLSSDLQNDIVTNFKQLKTEFVAVRSSATAEDSTTASWAGELESYLNVSEKTLLPDIKRCWSSLFTPRAILYRFEKKLLDKSIGVAVIIQEMVDSEISGVAFTVHPVTRDKNQMIIEAGYGLGEAIVSGSITTDSYILDKGNLSLLAVSIACQTKEIRKNINGGIGWVSVPGDNGQKQKLNSDQIKELAKLCLEIEKLFELPCDIEWAQNKGKFFITQSRPITTL